MSCNEKETIPSLYEVLSGTADGGCEDDGDSPYTLVKFEQFLVKSHCDENYEFWKTCNGYLRCCDDEDFDVDGWNSKVYKSFIMDNSPMECNLPTEVKKGFQESYNSCGRLPRTVLHKARQHAWSLMTDAYRQYVRHINHNCTTPSSCCASPHSGAKIRQDLSPPTLLLPAIELPTLVTGKFNSKSQHHSYSRSNSASSGGPGTPSSVEESPTESPDAVVAGTQRLLSKGRELMSRFRTKHRRTSFATPSSTNSLYTRFERRPSDRTLYQK
ncbi:ZYBA0S12-01024g1_1 [Zygosaccharomyces bailii CLIB 213]|uniref:ZYBA0S12-01024g1_1 n=1 Tax=Zygosaccharomyces bailii (strain CLIB 213 / ATCC 58445 / CBS 680 / BCRC 21525 / NBRC 1098 / NCYC 1416 / NRRL Y-2227) TaxID=1333698 RepID=A0A8J2XDZ1_ZYGB2|nr:ZYBA0S12-01024g1_1 [Zygosaccharomyces bailii CLIB 213]